MAFRIDNDNINRITRSLAAIIANREQDITNMGNIINGLSYVKKEQDTDPNPIDTLTGNTISDERMQEIYDNCVTKAEAIINPDDAQ